MKAPRHHLYRVGGLDKVTDTLTINAVAPDTKSDSATCDFAALGPRIDLGRVDPPSKITVIASRYIRQFSHLEFNSGTFQLIGQTSLDLTPQGPGGAEYFLTQISRYVTLRRSECRTTLFFIECYNGKLEPLFLLRNLPPVQNATIPDDFHAWLTATNPGLEFPQLSSELVRALLADADFQFHPRLDYAACLFQWCSVSKQQLKNDQILSSGMSEIQKELSDNAELFAGFDSPKVAQETAFRVLVSYFNFHGFAAFKTLRIRTIVILLKVCATEGEICDSFRFIRACFWRFLIEPAEGLGPVLKKVGDVLKQRKMEWVIGFYREKRVDNLDFFMPDCESMFMDCFDDVGPLWMAFARQPQDFFAYFLAAFLVVMIPSLEQRFFVAYGEFVWYFQTLKREIPLVQIMRVAEALRRPNGAE
jgi:hypothetical protein